VTFGLGRSLVGSYEAEVRGDSVQPVVEGGDVPPCCARGEEDAALGQTQLGAHPQLGEVTRCFGVEGNDLYTELTQRTLRQLGSRYRASAALTSSRPPVRVLPDSDEVGTALPRMAAFRAAAVDVGLTEA